MPNPETSISPPPRGPQPIAAPATGRFLRACLRQPVDRTPVWFLRQAGRYMPEYMAVRRHHSLLEICRTPDLAAEVTITAAERLGVDAAIIFADLLLPLTPLGLDFDFTPGEGPIIHSPIRSLDQIQTLRTDRTADLLYVSRAIEQVARHFALKSGGSALKESGSVLKGTGFSPSITPASPPGALAPEAMPLGPQDALGIIGFCAAPFTLASYMIEGASSRNYIETKRLMYAASPPITTIPEDLQHPLHRRHPERSEGPPHFAGAGPTSTGAETAAWPLLMHKLVTVLADFAAQQVAAGAQVIQVFDSWAGALSVRDYRAYCLAPTTDLIQRIKNLGVPVIYFGVDTASLLPTFLETGADVLGLDWRIPLDTARRTLDAATHALDPTAHAPAVQGNLDPITLFAPPGILESRVRDILTQNANRPGHIFNLGHGIVPTTPVDAVLHVVNLLKQS